MISFVSSGNPKRSELMELKVSDKPKTRGLPLRVAYIVFEPLTKKPSENVPTIFLVKSRIASIGLLYLFNNLLNISAITSESVSDIIFLPSNE